jgi:NAD(P)-dependent dehydrogenase (short-subunit alcohol dehydrogenase family)
MDNLKNKVAVVFAASGEIAGAVARSFAQHGAKVYVTARNLDAVKALASEIKANGGDAEAAKVDALNETEIDNFLKIVVADNGKLDVVLMVSQLNTARWVVVPQQLRLALSNSWLRCKKSLAHNSLLRGWQRSI